MVVLTPDKAAAVIRSGRAPGPMRVHGRLELAGLPLPHLPAGLSCYELDCTNSALVDLPQDLSVDSRLVLDGCASLKALPRGLTAGAISLRNCTALTNLPEGIRTWFLDLTGCERFTEWPSEGTVRSRRR